MSKVALITGGASGMGLAVSKAFAAEGWKIAIADLNTSAGEDLARELNSKFYKTDVTDYDNLANTFAEAWKDYGKLDFVFANAGIVEKLNFYERHDSDIPPKLNTLVLDINLKAVVNTTYLATHFFRKNSTPGGAIIITASTGAIYPVPFLPMYGAAKHGCLGFMRSVAIELEKENIRANCICPGPVKTGLLSQQEWDKFPKGAFVPIEKVVEAVKMLVDDQTMNGKAVELIHEKWIFRDPPVFDDKELQESMIMSETPFQWAEGK